MFVGTATLAHTVKAPCQLCQPENDLDLGAEPDPDAESISHQMRLGTFIERRRLSTVDLLVLTSLDQLLFILKILLTFFTKQATFMRRSTVLRLPPQLVWNNAY